MCSAMPLNVHSLTKRPVAPSSITGDLCAGVPIALATSASRMPIRSGPTSSMSSSLQPNATSSATSQIRIARRSIEVCSPAYG